MQSTQTFEAEAPCTDEDLPLAHKIQLLSESAPVEVKYFPDQQRLHKDIPGRLLYLPAAQAVQVAFPASEDVPAEQLVELLAPTTASCVTDPVAVQVVEASMGPSYTEW